MKKRELWLILAAAVLFSCTKQPAAEKKPAADGVPDFSLTDYTGAAHSLYRDAGAPAVVIIGQGNDCPIIQRYSERIHELAEKWKKRGVPFYLLNANTQDTPRAVAKEAADYKFGAPILLDPTQAAARALGITRTAEAVILEPGTWRVLFRGAIDDRLGYGVNKQQPQTHFLDDALESVVAGQPVKVQPPPAKGCLISFRKPKP